MIKKYQYHWRRRECSNEMDSLEDLFFFNENRFVLDTVLFSYCGKLICVEWCSTCNWHLPLTCWVISIIQSFPFWERQFSASQTVHKSNAAFATEMVFWAGSLHSRQRVCSIRLSMRIHNVWRGSLYLLCCQKYKKKKTDNNVGPIRCNGNAHMPCRAAPVCST